MRGGRSLTLAGEVALAEAVRRAVLDIPGVVAISPGVGYIEATYGRDVEVVGIGIDTKSGHIGVDAHLVVGEIPIPPLAKRVRAVIRQTILEHADLPVGPINLYIDDVQVNGAGA